MSLFIYTISVLGLAFIVGHSKISVPFREWLADLRERRNYVAGFFLEMFECAACFSFHIGWIVALCGFRLGYGALLLDAAVLALYSCGASLLLGKFAGIVE